MWRKNAVIEADDITLKHEGEGESAFKIFKSDEGYNYPFKKEYDGQN